jgi:hypothetical protein
MRREVSPAALSGALALSYRPPRWGFGVVVPAGNP